MKVRAEEIKWVTLRTQYQPATINMVPQPLANMADQHGWNRTLQMVLEEKWHPPLMGNRQLADTLLESVFHYPCGITLLIIDFEMPIGSCIIHTHPSLPVNCWKYLLAQCLGLGPRLSVSHCQRHWFHASMKCRNEPSPRRLFPPKCSNGALKRKVLIISVST